VKNYLNFKFFFIWLVVLMCVIGGVVFAGSLTPPGSPESTMISLSNIYEKLTTGVTSTEKTFSPNSEPGSTMYTLGDIFDAIPEWLTLSDATTTVPAGY